MYSAPTVSADSKLYVRENDNVRAHDAKSGKLLWIARQRLDGRYS